MIADIKPGDYTDGMIAQAVRSIQADVSEIKSHMVYREEFKQTVSAVTSRMDRIEASPTNVRGWLDSGFNVVFGLVTAGGCLMNMLLAAAALLIALLHH